MEPNLNEPSFQAPVWLTRVDIEIQTKKSIFFELKAGNFQFSSQPSSNKDSSGKIQQNRSWKNLSLQIPSTTASKIDIYILVHKKKKSKHPKILGQGCFSKSMLIYNHSLLSDEHAERQSQSAELPIQSGAVLIIVRLYPLVTSPVVWMELHKLDQIKAFSELERLCVQKMEGQLGLYLTSSVMKCLQERLAKWAYQRTVERNGKTKSARLAAQVANDIEDAIFRIWTYLVSSSKLNPILIRYHSGPSIAAHLKLSVPRLSSLLELLKSLMNANNSDMRMILGYVLNLLQLAVNKALKKRNNGKHIKVAGLCFQLIRYLDLKYLKPLMKTNLPSIIVQIISDASSPQLLDNAFDTIKFFGTDLKAEIASSNLFDALKALSETDASPHLRLKSVYLLSKFSVLPLEHTSKLIQTLSLPILEDNDLPTRFRNTTQLSSLLVSFDEQTLHSTLQHPELLDLLLRSLVLQTNQKLITSLILARIAPPVWIKASFPFHFRAALENKALDWMSLCFLLSLVLQLSNESFLSTTSDALLTLCTDVFAPPPPPTFIPPLPSIPSCSATVTQLDPISTTTDSGSALAVSPDTFENTDSDLPFPPSSDTADLPVIGNDQIDPHSYHEGVSSPVHPTPQITFAGRLISIWDDSLKIIPTFEDLGIWSYLLSSVDGESKIAVFIFLCRLPTPILIYLSLKHDLIDIIGRKLSDIDEIDYQVGYTLRFAFLGALVRLSSLPLPSSLNLRLKLAKIASSSMAHVAIHTDWQMVTAILDLIWPHPEAFRSAVSVIVNPDINGVVEYLLPWVCESMERGIRSGPSCAEVLYYSIKLAKKMILPNLKELFSNYTGFTMTPEMKSRRALLQSYGLSSGNPTNEEQLNSYFGAEIQSNYANLGFFMPQKLEKPDLAKMLLGIELDDSASVPRSHSAWSEPMDLTEQSSDRNTDYNYEISFDETETNFSDDESTDLTSLSSSSYAYGISQTTMDSSYDDTDSSSSSSLDNSDSSGSTGSSSSSSGSISSSISSSSSGSSVGSTDPESSTYSDDEQSGFQPYEIDESTDISETGTFNDSESDLGSELSFEYSDFSDSEFSWSRSDVLEDSSIFDDSGSFYVSDGIYSDSGGDWYAPSVAIPIENAFFNRFAILFPRSLTIMSLKHFNKLSFYIKDIRGRISSTTASTILSRGMQFPSWVERADRDNIYDAYCSEILFEKTVELLSDEHRSISPPLWKLLIEYSVAVDVPLMHNLKYLQSVRSVETTSEEGLLESHASAFCPLSIPDDGLSLSARWSSVPIVGPSMRFSPPNITESSQPPPLVASLDSDNAFLLTSNCYNVPFYPLPPHERDIAYAALRREALSPSKPPAFLSTSSSVSALFSWAEAIISVRYPTDSPDAIRTLDSQMLFLWSTLFWIAKSITDSKTLDKLANHMELLISKATNDRWNHTFDSISTCCLLLLATSSNLGERLQYIKGAFHAGWYPFTPAIHDFWACYEKWTDSSVKDIYLDYSELFGKKTSSFNRPKERCISAGEKIALKCTSLSHISVLCCTVSCSLRQSLESKKYDSLELGFVGRSAIVASEQILSQMVAVTKTDPTIASIFSSPISAILELSSRGRGSPFSSETMVTPFRIGVPTSRQPPDYSTDATEMGFHYALVLLEHLIALGRLIAKFAVLCPNLLEVYFSVELLTISQLLGDPSLPLSWAIYPILLLDWSKQSRGPLLHNLRENCFRSYSPLFARHLHLLLSSEWTHHYALIALIAGLGDSPDAIEAELLIASFAIGQPESALSRCALAAFISRNPTFGIQILPGPLTHQFWAFKQDASAEALPAWEIISLLPTSMLSELVLSSSDISLTLVHKLSHSIWSNDILRKIASSLSKNADGTIQPTFPASSDLIKLFDIRHSFSDPRTFFIYAISMSESLLQVSNYPLRFVMSCPNLVVQWMKQNGATVTLQQIIENATWKNRLEVACRLMLILASMPLDQQLEVSLLHDIVKFLWSLISHRLKNKHPGQWYFELGAALLFLESFKAENYSTWATYAKAWHKALSHPALPTPSSQRYTSPLVYHMSLALGFSHITEENLVQLPTYLSTARPMQDKPPSALKKFSKIGDAVSSLLRPPSFTISTTALGYRFIKYDHGYVLPPCTDPVHVVLSNPICNAYEELCYGPNPPSRIKFQMMHLRTEEEPEIVACIGLATAGALEQIKSDCSLRVGDVEGSWCVDISPLGLCSRSNGRLGPISPRHRESPKPVPITGLPGKSSTMCNLWSVELDLAQPSLRVRAGCQKLVVHDIDVSSPLFIVISYQSPAVATLGRSSGADLDWFELSAAYPFEALPLIHSSVYSLKDPPTSASTTDRGLKKSKKRQK